MAAEPQPHDALIGTILADRYQIEQRIGAGAMGAVYKARHIKVGRPFAVKLLHAKLLDDVKVALRFEREAELAGRLRHVNVIGVIDVGETADGIRYMVMDFAEGEDLAGLLAEAPMPPDRIINLVRQMLEGLWHAHEHGLIHRDFKPENVIVEQDQNGVEVPRIIDFGIAILHDDGMSIDADGRLTTNGLVLGTPHYMAPEQAVSDPLDHRVDLFALGLVIYEMLCGRLPFDGSGAEVARANLMLDPPKISVRVPHLEVDPLLEAFSRLLMSKRRDQRPSSARTARELLDLIERDRDAAAAALKVPANAIRGPMTTAPATPIPLAPRDLSDTFPPPMQAAPVLARQTQTPPQAPPLLNPIAIMSQRDIRTSVADPIEVAPKRHRGALIAGISGGVVVAGILAVVLIGGRGDPAQVAIAAVQPDAAPVVDTRPKVPTVPTVIEETNKPDVPTGPKPVDIKPIDPKPPKPVDPKPDIKPTAKPALKPVDVKPAIKPNDMTVKHPDPKPLVKPVAKPAFIAVGTETISAQYSKVGGALKTLQDRRGADATNDLWPLYRRINIMEVMKTPEARSNAYNDLIAIQELISARSR
jgi:serine/threonine protein kinase